MTSLAEDIIRTWKEDAKIRQEFGNLSTYAAYREAEAAGRVKVHGANTVSQKGEE